MASMLGPVFLLCALALATQASAAMQPSPFGSFFALSRKAMDRRPSRSLGTVRIVNGDDATPGQFPHQVGIYVDMSAFCGGALIHPKWILTAATCTSHEGTYARYTAFLGAQNLNLPAEKNRVAVTTTKAYVHEEFDAAAYKNDVALLLLPREVKTTAFIQPINLPKKSSAGQNYADAAFLFSGWGYQSDNSVTISPSLKYASLTGTDKKTCVNTYSYEIVTDDILCCVGANKQSPCQGDTGGALVQKEKDGTLTHIAVASFTPGKGCSLGKPSGFTKTASYIDWIYGKTGILATLQ